ncbi:DDE Tnp4 domain-containing protein [Trichonephila clavipes]|nr:DDE Tnp4 domain-containing protein [Trichonephila clavipes]
MLDLLKKPTYLQQTVEEYGFARKRAIWTLLSNSDIPEYPRLPWKELPYLTIGIYRAKRSQSYTHEHHNQSGVYSFYVNREDSSAVRLQFISRRTSSKTKTPSLVYADTLQDAATGRSSDKSARESEKKI